MLALSFGGCGVKRRGRLVRGESQVKAVWARGWRMALVRMTACDVKCSLCVERDRAALAEERASGAASYTTPAVQNPRWQLSKVGSCIMQVQWTDSSPPLPSRMSRLFQPRDAVRPRPSRNLPERDARRHMPAGVRHHSPANHTFAADLQDAQISPASVVNARGSDHTRRCGWIWSFQVARPDSGKTISWHRPAVFSPF